LRGGLKTIKTIAKKRFCIILILYKENPILDLLRGTNVLPCMKDICGLEIEVLHTILPNSIPGGGGGGGFCSRILYFPIVQTSASLLQTFSSNPFTTKKRLFLSGIVCCSASKCILINTQNLYC
jgi:hypothetical protein